MSQTSSKVKRAGTPAWSRGRRSLVRLAVIGVMAALVFVVSRFAFPFLGSKVHFGNTVGILAGLLFGPLTGGVAAGLGSFLTDVLGGYPFWEALITFVSKFAMAAVAGLIGLIARRQKQVVHSVLAVLGSAAGALSYTALYMAKHFVLQFLVYQVGWEATAGVMLAKLPASLINALFATICAPVLYHALRAALVRIPAYRYLTDSQKS